MQNFSFIALVTFIFGCPFVPAIWTALNAKKERFRFFWMAECFVCLLVGLSYIYLSEIAPHQGIVSSNIFTIKNPSVVVVWNAVNCLFPILGCLIGAFFAREYFLLKSVGRNLGVSAIAIFCFGYGLSAPFLMSHLVATIRDSFLIN